jgi:two-component system chemotaxis sensor kinase CheA
MSPSGQRDPYKYFRVEAREIWDALQRGALDLEKGAPAKEAAKDLLRYAHTLKGAARIMGLSAVAALAHRVEDELEPLRAGLSATPAGLAGRVFALLDSINAELAALAPASAVPASALAARALESAPDPRRLESVRLEVSELDEVMGDQREASARLAVLRRQAGGLVQARALAHSLVDADGPGTRDWKARAMELEAWLDRFDRLSLATLEQAVRELDVAHARVGRMRLSPASSLFGFLERACRDAAEALAKPVRFESSGGDQRLDAPVLLALQVLLQHAVRNAVVHGIENAAERARAGKPAHGTVRVELRMSAGRAIFRCSDDGRGLDQAAILKVARQRGLWAQGGPLSPEAAADLVLGGGLSTAKELTELAGRGLGMDVLREGMGRLKGKLEMKSLPGRGVELCLDVPASLSAYQVLEVEAGGLQALLPFAAVRSAQLLERRELSRMAEGEALLPDGQVLPLLRLDGCFGPERGRPRFAVLLGTGLGQAAVGVDRILGVREAVMLPLPDLSPFNELTLGACLDAAGEPCLLLDPESLVKAARLYRAPGAGPGVGSRLPLLVVDDSLTTRMLEQSILETAGYAVDVAASAEEGLAKLRQRRYGVLLVDVEMPGMSGFELLELMQGELGLRDIPAILVTSCATPEDKRRGRAAGAKDYIVKGEFDQSRLLSRIGALLA